MESCNGRRDAGRRDCSNLEIFAANRASGTVALEVMARDGVTRRGELTESGSLRVRFPSPEAEGLSAVFVNTAGGIAGGDRFDIAIAARAASRLTVTAAAAEKSIARMAPRPGSRSRSASRTTPISPGCRRKPSCSTAPG